MGFSAGGDLTAHMSTNFSARSYPHIDSADDFTNRPDFSLLVYPWNLVSSANMRTLQRVPSSSTPASFLAHAEDDTIAPVQGSIEYYLGLKEAKAPASELHVYSAGGHGLGRCKYPVSTEPMCAWPGRAEAFLTRLLNLKTPAFLV
eukprot:TRINITY_DN8442_c0_g1_i3.p2 TRINITY_DN8442_c0_g1~~TRINITY_DN8442_c0_g1_i3.p2  ORF type:complete len:146 (-),score=12.17 TRINITY_DN8442_c0_g1_i3:58-495(-)